MRCRIISKKELPNERCGNNPLMPWPCSGNSRRRDVVNRALSGADAAAQEALDAEPLLVSAASIDVVEPDDVVLIEVSAQLDFDEEGRDLSGIAEAMFLTDGDIGGLVLAEQLDLLALGDFERALDHHPML